MTEPVYGIDWTPFITEPISEPDGVPCETTIDYIDEHTGEVIQSRTGQTYYLKIDQPRRILVIE